jgi:asparagine synthase (glutamine-hydrolysing)
MCGFVGYFGGSAARHADEKIIGAMADAIRHRGPDDEEYYSDSDYSVGFRRLSIIDLDGGAQPMKNEDGSLILVYNGEIYNYKHIREELLAAGHVFATKSDSEILLHGYEEWGEGVLDRLRGMFAFVIYDKGRRELFGARDFFGIKPLYYAQVGDAFLFGSEIKSFLKHPDFTKELNERALESYLSFQYSPGPETFFNNVYKLTPGHWFRYSGADGFRSERYWLPTFDAEDGKGIEYWTDAIECVFDDSVAAHKISDVEVGSFLSSGVDSSYVACSAGVDKTFTVGFDAGSAYNETDYARELSEMIPVKNIPKLITAEEFWEAFPKAQYHMDEPLADPSAIALWFVCRTASQYLKVVLSGEGADEIFGGYNIYREPIDAGFYGRLPFALRRAVGGAAAKLPAKRGRNFLVRHGKRLEKRFIGNAYMFTESERRALLKNPACAPAPDEVVRPWYEMAKGKDPVTKMQFVDLNAWMVGDILLKADKMSMAHSLELRVPFLDREVMKLAGRIPVRYRVNKENTKYAMRLAAARRMPPKWSTKKKLGFPVPTRVWLADEKYSAIVRAAFTSETAERFFNTAPLVQLLDDHKSGKADNSRKIWTVYTFLVWYGQYFGGDGNCRA